MHRWDLTPKEAIALQKDLRERVRLVPLAKEPTLIGGCDVSMNRFAKEGFAGFVTLSYPELRLLDRAVVKREIPFPYVPGLLSFREIPMLLDAWQELGTKPEVLLVDGIGDLVRVDGKSGPRTCMHLGYDILQAAGVRRTKPEYVACPSCGRTLFDLQTTTQKIRARTAHLKNISIAIMGCIVNGPGEMADADFGYVGGAPSKVNLYVGRECVKKNIPEEEAPEALVALIKEHGRWSEPAGA